MRCGRPDRRLVAAVAAAVAVAALYLALPAIAGLDETWRLLKSRRTPGGWASGSRSRWGRTRATCCCSAACSGRVDGIGVRRSLEITLAGVAATRLLATAGAGGVALHRLGPAPLGHGTRGRGQRAHHVPCRSLRRLHVGARGDRGSGSHFGLLPGPAPFALTVVAGRLRGAGSYCHRARRGERARRPARSGCPARTGGSGSCAQGLSAVARGVRGAVRLLRARDVGLLGAIAWWGFDLAVLWACFHAFGGAPPVAVVVMVYFVGMLANTLPLPEGSAARRAG